MPWNAKAIDLWVNDCTIEIEPLVRDENVDPNATVQCRKRRRGDKESTATEPRAFKRRALRHMPTESPGKTRGTQVRGGRRRSKGRDTGQARPASEAAQQTQGTFDGIDIYATPRAHSRTRSKRRWISELGDVDSPAKRSETSASDEAGSSRSASPSKRNVLRSLPQPIRNRPIEVIELSEEEMTLLRKLRRCAAGFETVPETLLPHLKATCPDDMDLLHNVTYGPRSERSMIGKDPKLDEILMVVSEAKDCRERSETEATWDTHVVGPILTIARALSIHRAQVGTTNVTTAKTNIKYKPVTDAGQQPLQGKVVDFVFFLQASHATSAAFRHLPWETGTHGRDFNHTLHAPIADRPIAVSVETKREGEGQTVGQGQLNVWVAAQYNRLQHLLNDVGSNHLEQLPTLPLLLAQGPVWSLSLAQRHPEGGQPGDWTTAIYEKVVIGDATTASGVCKILATLLLLFDWMETRYRLWFETLCTRIVEFNR